MVIKTNQKFTEFLGSAMLNNIFSQGSEEGGGVRGQKSKT